MLLPNKNSAVDGNQGNVFLKKLSSIVKVPFTLILNKSLNERVCPSPMKMAKVMILYKLKECHLLNKYRPISILIIVKNSGESNVQKGFKFLSKNSYYKKVYMVLEAHDELHMYYLS